jgi:hypothetical protein
MDWLGWYWIVLMIALAFAVGYFVGALRHIRR